MIIINDKPGQLCNQLWSYVPFISFCLENDITFISLYFEDNYKFFENLNIENKIKFGYTGNTSVDVLLRKVLFRSVQRTPFFLLDIFSAKVDKQKWQNENWPVEVLCTEKFKIFLGAGIHQKNNTYLDKYHERIRQIFSPKKIFREKVETYFIKRKIDTLIIGIHLRRGDYIDFFDGKYYYSNEIYAKHMKSIENDATSKGKKVSFLLCSNEKINLQHFAAFECFQIKDCNAIMDLYALSLCDYMLGPPSTFSMWSSFYGKVPLKFILPTSESIALAEFSIIVAQDTFASGSKFSHD
ncbi:MAG: hypothetical protein EOO44_04135 [Flavobacterium sp.]|uniref:alpha-1,2-fucosyltransferase n=1 Tax=Pedobacter agri TaxID=454586 RepID=UPI00120924E1|nr:alpha-1,2-fucosyltransferase [Pedobacter agri]MDQ1141881.1 hypothetical protein [Pedobacter agri]RZJ54667.1 MAG: hypothetical protein EOO44_04135 [Flavobacterium sp.]